MRAAGELDPFRPLWEALPVGVVLSDAAGRAFYSNPAFEAMAGARAGVGWEEIVHPDDRARMVSRWRAFVQSGGTLKEEFRFQRGAALIWCEEFAAPIGGPGGEVRGYIAVFQEVTARVAALQLMRESEDRLRAFFEHAGVGLVIASRDGRLLRVNRAYARFLGREPDELIGGDVLDLIHPDDHAHTLRMREELRAGRIEGYETERRYLHRDGSTVWGHATVTASTSGTLVGVVQDIDSRKRAEDAVRHLSGRFLQLQDEERRRIARSLHESAAQTVAALSMNLQRMERMQLPPHAAEALSDSLSLVAQASREIRTLSHLLHPPLLEESGLLAALRWYVEGFGARSNVQVELEVADDLGRLPTDVEITLFRIVQEGLTNVHRHSGSRTAAVRLKREGAEVALSLEDHGVGMRADALDRVREGAGGGVGVGIAGMRERLAQLGGRLEIQSGPHGTTVRATIRSEG
ncbi:MAG TPA: PAS domain S-box protein [Myxococcales bacterium]|nr:PAS domain S-box protein [Myxococcales bacterium]